MRKQNDQIDGKATYLILRLDDLNTVNVNLYKPVCPPKSLPPFNPAPHPPHTRSPHPLSKWFSPPLPPTYFNHSPHLHPNSSHLCHAHSQSCWPSWVHSWAPLSWSCGNPGPDCKGCGPASSGGAWQPSSRHSWPPSAGGCKAPPLAPPASCMREAC